MEEGFRDFQAWFNRKPIFARTYLIIVVALAVIVWMKIVSPYHLYYTFETGFLNLQLWRPFTAILFMGKLDFSFIFSIMFVHIGLVKVET